MVTGSWDQTVKLWDPRTPCNAGTFSQPEKVCTGCRILGDTSSDWLNIAVQDTVLNLIELKKLCLMISKVWKCCIFKHWYSEYIAILG